MGKYFTIEELSKSAKAKRLGIDNKPDKEIEEHLTTLIDTILDPVREQWGSAIRCTSGYRCKDLNTAVRGAATSAHQYGWAVDLIPKTGTVDALFEFFKWFLEGQNIKWDQLIIESSKTGKWVHFGLKNKDGKQRCQIFALDVK